MFSKIVLLSPRNEECHDDTSENTVVLAQETFPPNTRRIYGYGRHTGAGHYGNRRHGMAAVDDDSALGA